MVYIIGESVPDDGSGGSIIVKMNRDKTNFILNGDKIGIGACRIILGEVQRDPDKDYSDENITEILRGLRRMTLKSPDVDHLIIQLIDTYIPAPVSDVEVNQWLNDNGYNEDMLKTMGKRAYSVIGMVKKHFKGRDYNASFLKETIDKLQGE